MQKRVKLSLFVISLFIISLAPLPASAVESDISITSPANGSVYNAGSTTTFSWTSPRSGIYWRMYSQIDSGSWIARSLPSGSFSQSLSSGSHTFSVKIQHYEQRCFGSGWFRMCSYTFITKDIDTNSFSVEASETPNQISMYHTGNTLKNFKSGSNSDFRLRVGNTGEVLHSDYIKLYFKDSSGSYATSKTIYLPGDYEAGEILTISVAESDLYRTASKGSAEYSHYLYARNYYNGDYTSDSSATFNVKWQKAKLTFTFSSFKLSGTETGKEEYRFEFKNNDKKFNFGSGSYDDGKEVTVNWVMTFDDFERDFDLFIKIKEKDDWFDDDRIFEGNLDFNYEQSEAYGPTSVKTLSADDKTHTNNDIDIFRWDKTYIRGIDSWYYVKVKITIENLRGA